MGIDTRSIKFRAWNNIDRKMYSWEDITQDKYLLFSVMTNEFFACNPPKYTWEQMQFTGLKDIDGNEIYEGDIIHNEANDYKVVNYDRNNCYFCLMDFDNWPDKIYGGEMFNEPGENGFSHRIKVVGNIYIPTYFEKETNVN